MKATDFFAPILIDFQREISNNSEPIRSQIGFIELLVRTAHLLAIAARANAGKIGELPRSPGLGTMLSLINTTTKADAALPHGRMGQRTRQLCGAILNAFQSASNVAGIGGIKQLRDFLNHGGSTRPSDTKWKNAETKIKTVVDELIAALMSFLSGASIAVDADSHGVTIVWPDGELALEPLFVTDLAGGTVRMLWNATTGKATYATFDEQDARVEVSDEAVLLLLSERFLKTSDSDRLFGRLVHACQQDVGSFSEVGSTPQYFVDESRDGVVEIVWTRPTAQGPVRRLDEFRIGLSEQWQWRHEKDTTGVWCPYTSFLKLMTNWAASARQIRLTLERLSNKRRREDNRLLGMSPGWAQTYFAPPLTEVADPADGGPAQPKAFSALETALDNAVNARRKSTRIYLLTGEAGIGKSRYLLDASLNRARLIEQQPDEERPVFLYVSSTGDVLDNLDKAVTYFVDEAPSLTRRGVQALARNGLLVLIIDGFDELLGGGTFGDPLGSLRPWIDAIGGRGVIVNSARSSYVMARYRDSLQSASELVHHVTVNIGRWNEATVQQFVASTGHPVDVLQTVTPEEIRLLCVPFFARAYAAWCVNHPNKSDIGSFEIVINSYLQREASKLTVAAAGGAKLLSIDELRQIFTDIAEDVAGEPDRTVSLGDLYLAAQVAIGEDEAANRPGLAQRMVTLCGVVVTGTTSTQRRFGFEHEIILDCFVGVALLRRIGAGQWSHAQSILRKHTLHPVAATWLVDRDHRGAARLVEQWSASPASNEDKHSVARHNIGLIWSSLLENVPENTPARLRFARLDRIRVGQSSPRGLRLLDCDVHTLEITGDLKGPIALAGTSIVALVFENETAEGVKFASIDAERVETIHSVERYCDTPTSVRRLLVTIGAVEGPDAEFDSEAAEQAEFFLHRAARNTTGSIVVDANSLQTDDPRLKWTHKFGERAWSDFLQRLVRYDLVELVKFPAGGPKRQRVQFLKGPRSILEGRRATPVEGIWQDFIR